MVPRGAKDEEWSRVYYSIDLRVPDWIPGFVISILNSKALTEVRRSSDCRVGINLLAR